MVNEFERIIGARDDSAPANDVADPAESKRVVNQLNEDGSKEETTEVTPEQPTETVTERVTETPEERTTETVTETPVEVSSDEGGDSSDEG